MISFEKEVLILHFISNSNCTTSIPNAGPIAVNNRIQNVVANHFGSALVRFLVLPIRPSTIIVKAGRPTAVTKKPLIADVNDVPASKPIAGGKIKLPAPRKQCEGHKTDSE